MVLICVSVDKNMQELLKSHGLGKTNRKRIAILISGRGSNMEALMKACQLPDFPAEIVCVISNNKDAQGINTARDRGVKVYVFDGPNYNSQKKFDDVLYKCLKDNHIHIVCCAGFMQILGRDFIQVFQGVVLNIHPSLLPKFKGLHAIRQALQAKAIITGATVHYVNEKIDGGEIILQKSIAIHENDDEEKLTKRVLEIEHRIYPEALALICRDDEVFCR